MRYDGAVHLAIEAESQEVLRKLLEKIAEATKKQPGVLFAYPVAVPPGKLERQR